MSFSNADSCPGVMTFRWVFFSHRCFPFPCPSSVRDTREPCPFPLVSQLFLSSCVPMPTQPPLFGGISLSLQKVSLRCHFFPDPPELVRFFCFIFILSACPADHTVFAYMSVHLLSLSEIFECKNHDIYFIMSTQSSIHCSQCIC